MLSHTIDTQPFKPFVPDPRGHMKMLTGKRFGRLLVVSIYNKVKRHVYWLCLCDCKNWTVVAGSNLIKESKPTRSCGCLHKELQRASVKTHGSSVSREYGIYASAKSRCTNSSSTNYPNYGGRGIEFRFLSFEEFIEHIGPRPSRQHSLERIDNDGHYEIGNVKWATSKEQARNRRTNRILTWRGKSQSVADWGDELHLQVGVIHRRLFYGWTVERALSQGRREYPRRLKEIIEARNGTI